MARIEYERVFWHLVLDKGSGTGDLFDHATIQAFRNAGHSITFIAEANDDDPDEWDGHFVCTLTAGEARALAQQLLAEAATLDANSPPPHHPQQEEQTSQQRTRSPRRPAS